MKIVLARRVVSTAKDEAEQFVLVCSIRSVRTIRSLIVMADDGACPLPRKKPRLKVRTKLNPFTRDLFFEHFIRDNFMSDAAFRIVATSREFVDSARRIASKGVDFRWDVDRIEPTYGVTPFFSFFHDQNMTAAFLELIQPRVKDVVINFESDKPEELSPRILQRLVGAIRLEIDYYREQWEERASRGDWFPMIGRLFQTIGPSLISLDCPANHLALRDGVQPMSIEFLRLQCVSTDVCDFDQILTHRCRCLCIDFLEDCRGYRISNFCPLQPSIERLYIYDERFNIRYFPPSLFSRLPEIQTIAYHYCPERNAYDNDQRNHMSVIFSIQSFSFLAKEVLKHCKRLRKIVYSFKISLNAKNEDRAGIIRRYFDLLSAIRYKENQTITLHEQPIDDPELSSQIFDMIVMEMPFIEIRNGRSHIYIYT